MNHARKGLAEALQVIVEHVPAPDAEERMRRAYALILRAAEQVAAQERELQDGH